MSIKEKKNGIVSLVPINASEIKIANINNKFVKGKNVEGALDELKDDKSNLLTAIGDITKLTTNDKTSLVNAVNENTSQLSECAKKDGTLQTNLNSEMLGGKRIDEIFNKKPTVITNITDLTTLSQGHYAVEGALSTTYNHPYNSSFDHLTVIVSGATSGANGYKVITTSSCYGSVYVKYQTWDTWTPWKQIATTETKKFNIPLSSGLRNSNFFKTTIEKDGVGGCHLYINVEKSDGSKMSGVIQLGSKVDGIVPNGYCIGVGIAYDSDLSYESCMLYVDGGRIMAHVINPRSAIKGYVYFRCD